MARPPSGAIRLRHPRQRARYARAPPLFRTLLARSTSCAAAWNARTSNPAATRRTRRSTCGRTGACRPARRAATCRRCSRTCSTGWRRDTAFATSCTAPRSCSARTCRRRSAGRSTTGEGRMAGPRPEAARVHRRAAAQRGTRGPGDRARRPRPPLRPNSPPRHDGAAARTPPELADLPHGGAARFAGWHPCRQHVPPSAQRRRLAVVLPGRLRLPVARLPGRGQQPRQRGRVRQIPRR